MEPDTFEIKHNAIYRIGAFCNQCEYHVNTDKGNELCTKNHSLLECLYCIQMTDFSATPFEQRVVPHECPFYAEQMICQLNNEEEDDLVVCTFATTANHKVKIRKTKPYNSKKRIGYASNGSSIIIEKNGKM